MRLLKKRQLDIRLTKLANRRKGIVATITPHGDSVVDRSPECFRNFHGTSAQNGAECLANKLVSENT